MSKKGDRLRDRAEELRVNADHLRIEECHRISLELADVAEELADQWDALAVTMAGYLGERGRRSNDWPAHRSPLIGSDPD